MTNDLPEIQVRFTDQFQRRRSPTIRLERAAESRWWGTQRLLQPLNRTVMLPIWSKRSMRKSLDEVKKLEDLPNIGKAIATDLLSIGIERPDQLKIREPLDVFNELASVMGHRHDPCLLDVLISAKRFLEGEPVKPWWSYTNERRYAAQIIGVGCSWRLSVRVDRSRCNVTVEESRICPSNLIIVKAEQAGI
jgi:hypothetical protein